MTAHGYKPVAHDHQAFLARASKRKGFAEAYEALELEYQLDNRMFKAHLDLRLNQADKARIKRAADLRGVSVSAFVRDVVLREAGNETYELMEQRMAVLGGIARGEQAVADGRVASHAQAKRRVSRWLG